MQITYLYKDALGSTIAKADDKGNILWQENRLPFGKNTKLSNTEIANNPLQYTNAPLDSHSGLTYLKARYYNAEIGRFYASDPVWYDSNNSQSFNRYAYGNNNPYKYTDPTGLDKWSVVHKYQSNIKISEEQFRTGVEVASMVFTPIGMAQEYAENGFSWGMLMSAIPGISHTKKIRSAFAIPKAIGATVNITIKSQIKNNKYAIKLAKSLSDDAQKDVDNLLGQLKAGNANPGIGTRALGNGFFELRGKNAGRVIIKRKSSSSFDIVGKFQGHKRGDKANSDIINKLTDSYNKMGN